MEAATLAVAVAFGGHAMGMGGAHFGGMAMHGKSGLGVAHFVGPAMRTGGRRRYLPRRDRADRHAGIRVAAVHLHRVRADVLPDRRAVCIGVLPKHQRP